MKILDSIKTQIAPLPFKVKLCAVVFTIALFVGCFSSMIGYVKARIEIGSLQKQNHQLEKAAIDAQKRAAGFEQNAAAEALRSQTLETQLKTLQEKGNSQDNEIHSQTEKSSVLRSNLTGVRKSQPQSADENELKRKIEARYGKSNNN